MDLKKLFNNNKAVSPVIGVVLMVAITVILAAAIGSSVFGQGPAKSAPQANIDIKAAGIVDGESEDATSVASLKFEHLGGDPILFDEDAVVTKVLIEIKGTSYEIDASDLGTLDIGSVKTIPITFTDNDVEEGDVEEGDREIKSGTPVKVKVIDVQTKQLICDKSVRF